MWKLRDFQQRSFFQNRLIGLSRKTQDQSERHPSHLEKNALLEEARHAKVAAHVDDWINSPGLRPPT